MSNTVELLPGEPIVLQTLGDDFDYRADMPDGIKRILSLLDEQSQPIFVIIDARKITIGLDDLAAAASMATLQSDIFKHPKMREGIVITESRMIDLAVKGLSSPIFRSVKIKTFGNLDEALAYARNNAAMRDAM